MTAHDGAGSVRADLAATCPCGHTANYHPTQAQQDIRLKATSGLYASKCQGSPPMSPHCRCITTREQIMEAAS